MQSQQQQSQQVRIPRFYTPWPHQQAMWGTRRTRRFPYDVKLWARQTGKDTDDMQYCDYSAWTTPGRQIAYVGLDNVWITNNIFKKVIDNRSFWDDYPPEYVSVKDTVKEVLFTNNPDGYAQSRIKFIGFLNDQALIGSSYDEFFISEASLYKQSAFQFIQPIWDQKLAMGKDLSVHLNGTPRGTRNVFFELLRTYTGVDDPAYFPGEHGLIYVDKKTIEDIMVPDGDGGWKPLYTPDQIAEIRDRYIRQFGNDNLFRQEYYVDFTTVNAGLVYQGIEQLQNEGRYRIVNVNTEHPVYVAFDIASKGAVSDATAMVAYQYYGGQMFVLDIYEARGQSLIECIGDLVERDWWRYVKMGFLPWDSERSASSETPIEEARGRHPQITWHALDKERVDRGITEVRRMLPNMHIDNRRCDYLMECFNNYEYKRLESQDDWAARPMHNKYSHLMDALRYAVMGVREMQYLGMDENGSEQSRASTYAWFGDDDGDDEEKSRIPITWQKPRRRKSGLYY